MPSKIWKIEFLPALLILAILGFFFKKFSILFLLCMFLSSVMLFCCLLSFCQYFYMALLIFLMYVGGVLVLLAYFSSLQPKNEGQPVNFFPMAILLICFIPLINNSDLLKNNYSSKQNQFLFILADSMNILFFVFFLVFSLAIMSYMLSFHKNKSY